LLELEERTPEENDRMLHAAHASRYHWGEVGRGVNRVRGDWQLSRVYATLGRAEPALFHARRCIELCAGHEAELEEFDRPYAHEALARAHALAGDAADARRHAELARKLGEEMVGDDDRELLFRDLARLPIRG
jgi:hypothetical protein